MVWIYFTLSNIWLNIFQFLHYLLFYILQCIAHLFVWLWLESSFLANFCEYWYKIPNFSIFLFYIFGHIFSVQLQRGKFLRLSNPGPVVSAISSFCVHSYEGSPNERTSYMLMRVLLVMRTVMIRDQGQGTTDQDKRTATRGLLIKGPGSYTVMSESHIGDFHHFLHIRGMRSFHLMKRPLTWEPCWSRWS